MYTKRASAVFIVLLACGLFTQAFAQAQELELHSNADDIRKINDLLDDFRQDIIHKDGHALTKLMLYPNALFHSIDEQEFDGAGSSALDGCVKLLATSKDKLDERFRNIEIRQDGELGLVTFNYDFVINDKIHHSGLEHWQVRKSNGRWKILSITWTKYSHTDSEQAEARRGLVTCEIPN